MDRLPDDDDPPEPLGAIDDDRIRLILTCCHPALAMETRVALTLRMVAGLTMLEITRAFLVQEAGDDLAEVVGQVCWQGELLVGIGACQRGERVEQAVEEGECLASAVFGGDHQYAAAVGGSLRRWT